jgi:hypothetical protein
MNPRRSLLALAAAALFWTSILAAPPAPGPVATGTTPTVSVSDSAHVAKGEIHEGDVVAIFGDVIVEGSVTGQVVVVLGSLTLSGTVEGDVVTVLSEARLEETARIEGEYVNVGGALHRASGARVGGEVVNVDFHQFIPFVKGGWSGLWRFLFLVKLAKLAALFLILILVTALFPRRLATIAAALPRRWGWALLAGLLAYAAFAVGFTVLFCTILGIPLALALWFCMLATKWVGLAAILFLIGQTAGRNLFGRDLTHLASVLGGFVAYALLSLIPFFGFAFSLVTSFLAVGIALLTRFGSEEPWGRPALPATGGVPPPPPAQPDVTPPPVQRAQS